MFSNSRRYSRSFKKKRWNMTSVKKLRYLIEVCRDTDTKKLLENKLKYFNEYIEKNPNQMFEDSKKIDEMLTNLFF